MNKLMTNKNLTITNFSIVSFFVLIWFLNFYKIDFVLIGVFKELLTIPFFIAQEIFLILGVIFLITKKKRNYLTIISVLILAICAVITISSFL